MKIVMLEPLGISNDALHAFAAPLIANGHDFIPCETRLSDPADQIAAAADADVLIIASSPLSAEVIRASGSLKMISVAFTGVDHVDAAACRERSIVVCNAQGYCTNTVAELVFGHILSLLRNLNACDHRTREGGTKDGLVGHELEGRTLGIVGTGAIGRRVAEIARVFRCNLLGFDSFQHPEALSLGIRYTDLNDLFARSDIITLHTPLTEETRHMVNRERIGLMKPGALLINASRGPVVDSEVLAEALMAGRIAGAGLDVFDTEPPLYVTQPLLQAPHTLLTPHIAFATGESILRRAELTLGNITAWLDGAPRNVCL